MGSPPLFAAVAALLFGLGPSESASLRASAERAHCTIGDAAAHGCPEAALAAFDGATDERDDERHVPEADAVSELFVPIVRAHGPSLPTPGRWVVLRARPRPGAPRAPPALEH